MERDLKREKFIPKKPLEARLREKILILDGAMGTLIQQAGLTADDFGGEEYEGCNEVLVLTAPHIIRRIHDDYLRAGADMIETNTFGATRVVLAEYQLEEKVREVNMAAVRLAQEAVRAVSMPEWPRYVAGAMGPTTKTLSVTGGITFAELAAAYEEQAEALIEGGVDVLLLETAQDTLNVKAAGVGIQRAFEKLGREVPVMVSGTIEPMGTTLAGQNIEAFYLSVEHLNPLSVGLNCATGPEFMRDHLRSLSELASCSVSVYPNAGLPDEDGNYHETPQSFASKVSGFAEMGWLNIAGGCCGTTPDHIRELAGQLRQYAPRQPAAPHGHAVSGIEPLFLTADNRPLLVGERTNVIGSKTFRDLIAGEKYEEAAEIARAQVKKGAQVIDVCLADPDRDEVWDMTRFLDFAVKKVKVPLMLDSTEPVVLEKALQYSQGKAIINSINLEDGEKRFAEVVPLVHRYGAAVVVGTIDEEGMAVTRERKLAVARRSYDLLVRKYCLNPRDLIFDPLVFPVGTGDENYIGAAAETIEGIRLIKAHLPDCQTILGVSNVSFGLPPAGREVLNAVFLYHCTKAGLDYAIINTEKLERYASIPQEEREMAEALIFSAAETVDKVLASFTSFYRGKKTEKKQTLQNLSLEARLARYVVEGSKEGLIPDLDEALAKFPSPLEVINGPLMAGMDEVGRLFNDNQLIVAEVLQSAEVMKAAVAYLEPLMQKTKGSYRGKIILATVKGDVHDIGKNLVEIILSNNGYEVVNLGIKVSPEQLIEAFRREKPDMIGLSGLLVKSAQQMVVTAQDLRKAGIAAPILVGGAALSKKFTESRIAKEYDGLVLYAKDAMQGLELANRLQDEEGRWRLAEEIQVHKQKEPVLQVQEARADGFRGAQKPRRSEISQDAPVYLPPDYDRHILRDYPVEHLKPYLNDRMLLGRHLGLRGPVEKLLAEGDERALALKQLVDQLLDEGSAGGFIRPQGMYRFFPAQAQGDDILIYDPDTMNLFAPVARGRSGLEVNPGCQAAGETYEGGAGENRRELDTIGPVVLERFSFPRQQVSPYLCLSDFLKPVESGVMDSVAFFVVTAGQGIRELAEQWKEEGDYLRSYALQALALELAEAFAERVHQLLRDKWGIPDPPEMTMQERFAARYQGIRVSFGYPACPDLEDQAKLFRLMHPEEIGVELTEGFMMEPEASVSAMVFAHPEARYFNVALKEKVRS